MKKYEMLNQLQNEMKEARTTVEQLCADWGWTLSDKEATIVNNQIIISKGKVVEIPTVKEVVVDNTDTATIEMLRETIRQMNQNMNDMQKQHEEEIKELKEKLDFKELLLSEFRDNMDEKIENIHKLENEIEGMRFGYENKIAKLKEEKEIPEVIRRKDGSEVEVVDDPLYNEPEEEVVPQVEKTKVTKEEIKQTTSTSGLIFEIHKTHDAVKAKITAKNGKTFYAVWSVNDKKPAYSNVDKYNRYNRAKEWWVYDKHVMPELKALREELMNELKDKKNKNNTRKSASQATKEVAKETQEEKTIPTNDTVESTNDVSAIDDMEFF